MKKLFSMLFVIVLIFTACDKNKDAEQIAAESSFEFIVEQTEFFKSTNDNVPECSDLEMDYAVFDIDGITYTTNIYIVEGELLTEVIKLPVGTYQLTSFLVYNDNGTPNDLSDDILVKAAPAIGSEYWDLMSNKLALDITVEAFYKKQIEIDVLCFEDLYYESFGFTWFELNDFKIERMCFFGDICTDNYDDFAGSLYEDQPNGIQMDMPAIFQLKVFKENEPDPFKVFDNTEWLGVGSCLEVYWPNNINEDENFTFELWVLLPSDNGFDYVLVNTWDVQDGNGPDVGNDGVVDFVIGGCQYQDSDYEFPYWNESIIAHYPFNGNANDESGNNNNGSVHGAQLISDRFGNSNSAYYFDGVSNYISTEFIPTNINSISVWFKAEDNQPFNSGLFSTYGTSFNGYYVGFQRENPIANLYADGNTAILFDINSWDIWKHLVICSDGVSIKVYMDSELIETFEGTTSHSGNLYIGSSKYNSKYFKGVIDDIKIFDYPLTDNDVVNLFQEE